LKSQSPEPVPFSHEGGVLSLSGPALALLLQDVLAKGACFRFQAKGFSMAPFIKDGDVVTIAPPPENGAGLGDVVAFTHPNHGKLVVHRVIGKRRHSYFIGGDNTPEADGCIPAKNVLGYVTQIERMEREFISALARRDILLPCLLKRNS